MGLVPKHSTFWDRSHVMRDRSRLYGTGTPKTGEQHHYTVTHPCTNEPTLHVENNPIFGKLFEIFNPPAQLSPLNLVHGCRQQSVLFHLYLYIYLFPYD